MTLTNNAWGKLVSAISTFGLVAFAPAFAQSDRVFTVATWGGDYAEAQTRALFKPFANTKNIGFDVVDFPGDPAAVDYQIQSSNVQWDVIDLEIQDAIELCNRNALEPITAVLDNIDQSQFVQGAVTDCALGNVVWSTGVVYDPSWFGQDAAPTTMADFFDPSVRGARAVPANPMHLMELASLASGISPLDIYDSLGSSEGVALALDTLDGIAPLITWADGELEAMELVNQAAASMALLPHILPARQDIGGGLKLNFLWDAHLVQMDGFAVLRDSPFEGTASSFLIDSGLPDFQGTMSTLSLYGPTNLGALEFLSPSVLPWMPHAEGNRGGAIQMDARWWSTPAGEAAAAQFNDWMEKTR